MPDRIFFVICVIWGCICLSGLFVSLAAAVHDNHSHELQPIVGGVFHFDLEPRAPEGWWSPGYTHTMDQAIPERWRLGERWYPIRDLMGRPI